MISGEAPMISREAPMISREAPMISRKAPMISPALCGSGGRMGTAGCDVSTSKAQSR